LYFFCLCIGHIFVSLTGRKSNRTKACEVKKKEFLVIIKGSEESEILLISSGIYKGIQEKNGGFYRPPFFFV
jgi:hypothetical protein